ncbi:MAG: hypothetical protein HQM10_03715 [Candidatus Riflebacteria bacterium]|nr:hypothetical protein [Candidatus Riflebacteria bacterium]
MDAFINRESFFKGIVSCFDLFGSSYSPRRERNLRPSLYIDQRKSLSKIWQNTGDLISKSLEEGTSIKDECKQ